MIFFTKIVFFIHIYFTNVFLNYFLELKLANQDASVQFLASEFISSARKLVATLENGQKKVDSMKYLLETSPVGKLADLLGGAVESSFEARLELLDAVEIKERIGVATRIIQRHLSVKKPCKFKRKITAKTTPK